MTDKTEVQAADEAAGNDEFDNAFDEFSKARETTDETAADDLPQDDQEKDAQPEENAAEQGSQPNANQTEDDIARRLEEAERRAQDLEHRLKSDTGRQAVLQRKVQELQAQLEAGPKTQDSERKYSAKMKQLMADFPEIAEALQEELDSRLGKVQ